jgi:hypothetical protein
VPPGARIVRERSFMPSLPVILFNELTRLPFHWLGEVHRQSHPINSGWPTLQVFLKRNLSAKRQQRRVPKFSSRRDGGQAYTRISPLAAIGCSGWVGLRRASAKIWGSDEKYRR